MQHRLGRQTVALENPAVILSHAAVGGRQEGEGPLSEYFDHLSGDSFFGEKTWEKAESAMQKLALSKALEKANLAAEDLDYILAGDLLNQCIGTSFGLRDFGIPFYGLYGACSTMGESLALGQPAHPHRPVDRHGLRVRHPGGRGAGPPDHCGHLREDRGQGGHRRQQYGRGHGPRRL